MGLFDFFRRPPAKESNWIPDLQRNLVIYIGWPLDSPTEWKKVQSYEGSRLVTAEATIIDPHAVKSRLLVYPNGEVLDGRNLFSPLPVGLRFLEPAPAAKGTIPLDSAQMSFGNSICKVQHHQIRREKGKVVYATTLHNVSGGRFRIQRFAAFRKSGRNYRLTTVTGGFYSNEQFIAWFATPVDGWIPPNGQVTDENNYGGGCDGIWAYFGQTEDGNHFIATAALPS